MKRLAISNGRRRSGLAPLEFVLVLPLLLGVMALMINLRNAAVWKLRASTQDRNAAWRERWPRTGERNPAPLDFDAPATMSAHGGGAITLDQSGVDQWPAVRQSIGAVTVDDKLLDFSRGLLVGTSQVTRGLLMQSNWLALLGQFKYELEHLVLDDKFQFRQMGLGTNIMRRIPTIYPSVLDNAAPGLQQQYEQAYQMIIDSPMRPNLDVLDRDLELDAFHGGRDFHPRVGGFCGLDVGVVRAIRLPQLRSRIGDVPSQMKATFLSMYQAQLAAARKMRPPPAGLIAELEKKIQQLQAFSP